MPLQKVPLPIFFTQSHDESALPDMVGARLVNGIVEKIGDSPYIRKAPGLETMQTTGTAYAIDGQFWWDDLGMAITVCNGRFYRQTTPQGTMTDITGDALTVIGPVTFATNGWCLMAASGGKIVTWHLYGSPITAPGLTLATQKDRLKFSAFTYYINGVSYSKGATDNISPGTETIPDGKFGAVALDIDYAGTVTAVSAPLNATNPWYGTAAAAVTDLPACAVDKCRIGWVTAKNVGATFIFDTTEFDAAAVVEVYTDNTLYSAETTKFLADADAPTTVSHVDYIDGYILANKLDSNVWYWSDASTVMNWGALSFGSAEGSPDNNVALRVGSKEIVIFGKRSIEFFYDDGVSPFSPIQGAYQERGCIAPYSIVNAAGAWIFLDNERRVVALEGRTFTTLSGPYDNIIRDIDKVSDAYAAYFTIGMNSFYVISFPSVERSFSLNLTSKTWSEWGDWDAPVFGLWKGKSYCYATDWEMHLIGDNATGTVYKIRGDYFKQGTDDIRTLILTGHGTFGTYEPKIEEELILRLKRGVGNGDVEEPVVVYRYRNENMVWSNEKTISLGKVGDNNIIKRLFRQGVYRTRQREFVHSDASDFVLSDIEARILMVAGPTAGGK